MLTRRRFLIGSAALTCLLASGDTVLARRLLVGYPGSPWPSAASWTCSGAASMDTSLLALFSGLAITVTVGGVTQEAGYEPAAVYPALWTRDHAYVLWHKPSLKTAVQRRQFVTYTLSRRTTGAEADPDGGTLPADFIADRIDSAGVATYKNAGASKLPFMDGIAFVVLALWSDWNLTGDLTTYTASKTAIDACLAAIPRSVNGCVYSDPANPSVDYGFTDGVKKTGDVAYGTALQAWAYKMMSEMAGEGGSGAYSTLRAAAEAGLATVRKVNGYYKGSSGNNSGVDDVWATALVAAEGLAPTADRIASANAIKASYSTGSTDAFGYTSQITQYGLVRHLPSGQFWAGTSVTAGTYQNGGYWLTPVWDCVRAVNLVDPTLARSWACEAMTQVNDEHTAESDWTKVPYEWHNHGVGVGAMGYVASAAVVNRFV